VKLPEARLPASWLKKAGIAVVAVAAVSLMWAFNAVPPGSRGVVTQFGKIVGGNARMETDVRSFLRLFDPGVRVATADPRPPRGTEAA